MAYILRAGKTFTNPYDGVAITTAYGIVDDVEIHKQQKRATFKVTIYVSRAARVAGYSPLVDMTFVVIEPEFTTYFSPTLTTTIWAQCQAYLVATNPPGLNATDWRIDPQAEP